MHADHIVMLPIQGILAQLARPVSSSVQPRPPRTLLVARGTLYSNVDPTFIAAKANCTVIAHWMELMMKHAVDNCTRQRCAPGGSLASAVAKHSNATHTVSRDTLHYPSGSPEYIRSSLFHTGKHVQESALDALKDAFAVAVPGGDAWHRWANARSDATILQGHTGLDLAVRHLLHTEPAETYWHLAMQAVERLTAEGGGAPTDGESKV